MYVRMLAMIMLIYCCSVSIYPLDQRAVQLRDGSLPVTSYWYGKVVEIYLKAGRQVKERAACFHHPTSPH
jgi:hypothetical protein